MIYAMAGSTGMGVFEGGKERTPNSPFKSFSRLKSKQAGGRPVEFGRKYPKRFTQEPVFSPDGTVVGFRSQRPVLFSQKTETFKAQGTTSIDETVPSDIRPYTEPFSSAQGIGQFGQESGFTKFLTSVVTSAPDVINQIKQLRGGAPRMAPTYQPTIQQAAPASTPWGLYAAIGGGVVAVGVVAYFLVKGN